MVRWRLALLVSPLFLFFSLLALIQIISIEYGATPPITSTRPLRLDRQLQQLSSDPLNPRRLPTVLLIGVRKGGTRALLDAIALHPRVRAARKEVHFFDDQRNYEKGEDWYREQMPTSSVDQVTIEKTPAYFTNEAVPSRVHRFNPRMKLILIVREPLQRTISDFTQVFYNRLETNKSLPVFERAAFDRVNGKIDQSYKPIRNSLYAMHLSRWLQYFPLDQILILDGDVFVKDPLSQLRLVESFLGLPHSISSSQLVFKAEKGFFCFQKTPSSRVRCLGRTKGRAHRSIDKTVAKRLRRQFIPHNNKFFRLINRVFNW